MYGFKWELEVFSPDILVVLPCSGYLVVGLVVLLVVLETWWVLPQVQALVRVFTGPPRHTTELKGVDLDEMVQGWDHTYPNSPEDGPEYALPISTIAPCPPEFPSPQPSQEQVQEDLPPDQPPETPPTNPEGPKQWHFDVTLHWLNYMMALFTWPAFCHLRNKCWS